MKNLWMVAAATTVLISANAQDASTETQSIGIVIDAHALVDVVDDALVFDFTTDTPTEAGNGLVLGSNRQTSTFLNYSLMLSNGGLADGSISVKLANLKPGLALALAADGSAAMSLPSAQYGKLGTVTSTFDIGQGATGVPLTSTDQILIENIGTSYTGDGNGQGYEIFYDVSIEDYELLDADNGSQDVGTVTYTIAE